MKFLKYIWNRRKIENDSWVKKIQCGIYIFKCKCEGTERVLRKEILKKKALSIGTKSVTGLEEMG